MPCSRSPLRAPRYKWLCPRVAAAPMGGRPFIGGLGHCRLPLQGAWPWPATPTNGLAMVGCPLGRDENRKR
ncbi:hypothetical protein GW17_00033789 [Ensete ventricosum]|nr:hypothetical protein GW17_00033789 [Ensete ventricosum]